MNDFDVIIVGGGIAGASLGAGIAARLRTLLIEAEDNCGYHSTGRSAAFYLESYGGAHVAGLTRASADFLENPPKEFSERSFLFRRGALHVSRGDWPELPAAVPSRPVERGELERLVPGIRPCWVRALLEPGCADIDVAALHAAFLREFKRRGGGLATRSRLSSADFRSGRWKVTLADGSELSTRVLVNAAGGWADSVAASSGVAPLGIAPKRRTMVQLRIARSGLKSLPLVNDSGGNFYFKGESDQSVWLSPHDEIATAPCDAAPDEIDVATAVARFEGVVDWLVERVERRWAGLRSFAPDRLPVYGFDRDCPGFFWCAGQGGFGIQTSPAAARLCASLILGQDSDAMPADIDPEVFSPGRFGSSRGANGGGGLPAPPPTNRSTGEP